MADYSGAYGSGYRDPDPRRIQPIPTKMDGVSVKNSASITIEGDITMSKLRALTTKTIIPADAKVTIQKLDNGWQVGAEWTTQ